MGRPDGKVAVVAGDTAGIGSAGVARFAQQGALIAYVARLTPVLAIARCRSLPSRPAFPRNRG